MTWKFYISQFSPQPPYPIEDRVNEIHEIEKILSKSNNSVTSGSAHLK